MAYVAFEEVDGALPAPSSTLGMKWDKSPRHSQSSSPKALSKSNATRSFGAYHFESSSSSSEDGEGAKDVMDSPNTAPGGKKRKNRQLMQRYGIAHHKHKAEQALLSYELAESEPRSIANAILQRLRDVDGSLKLSELKTAFLGYSSRLDGEGGALSNSAPAGDGFGVSREEFCRRLIPYFQQIVQRVAYPTALKRRMNRRVHHLQSQSPHSLGGAGSGDSLEFTTGGSAVLPGDPWPNDIELMWDPEDDIEEQKDGGDIFTLSFSAWSRAFEALFAAVDCNGIGSLPWESFLSYLMDASLLGRIGTREVEVKLYEFVHSLHQQHLLGLNRIRHLPHRDQFLICCSDKISLVANSGSMPVRGLVPMPPVSSGKDAIIEHSYTAILAIVIEFCSAVAVSCTDSMVRFYALNRSAGQGGVGSMTFPVNQTAMFFDAPRKTLYCGGREGQLRNFDLSFRPSSGLEHTKVSESFPHRECISDICLVETENSVVTASYDRTLALVDARTLQVMKVFTGHNSAINRVVHVPDFNILVSTSFDIEPMICLVSLPNRPSFTMSDPKKPHIGVISDLTFLPSNNTVITMDIKGLTKVWDLRTFACVQSILASSTTLSSDGGSFPFLTITHTYTEPSPTQPLGTTRLFAGTRHRVFVFEYNYSQRSSTAKHTADDDAILTSQYNPDNQTILTASSNCVRLWDANSSAIRDTFRNPTHLEHGGISCAALHPAGRLFYVGTSNGSLFAHNVSTGSIINSIQHLHPGPILGIRYCENAGRAASSDLVISYSSEQLHAVFSRFSSPFELQDCDRPRCADFCEYTGSLVVGDLFGNLTVYATELLAPMRTKPLARLRFPKPTPREITSVRVIRTACLVACSDAEGHVALFGLRAHPSHHHKCVAVWKHCSDGSSIPPITSIEIYPRKNILYCGDETGHLSAYDLRQMLSVVSEMHDKGTNEKHRVAELRHNAVGTTQSAHTSSEGLLSLSSEGKLRSHGSEGERDREVLMNLVAHQQASPAVLNMRPSLLRQLVPNLRQERSGDTRSIHPQREETSALANPNVHEMLLSLDSAQFVTSSESDDDQLDDPTIDAQVTMSRYPVPGQGTVVNDLSSEAQELKMLSSRVMLLNRWRAHESAVTSISIRNDGLYGVLLTSGADQVVAGWTFAGGLYMGALDQYGRIGLALKAPVVADDIDEFAKYRDRIVTEVKSQESDKRLLHQPGCVVDPQLPHSLVLMAHMRRSDEASRHGKRKRRKDPLTLFVAIPSYVEHSEGSLVKQTVQSTEEEFLADFDEAEQRARRRKRRSRVDRTVVQAGKGSAEQSAPGGRSNYFQHDSKLLLYLEREARKEETRVIKSASEVARPKMTDSLADILSFQTVDDNEREIAKAEELMNLRPRTYVASGHASRWTEHHPPPPVELEPFPEGTFDKRGALTGPKRRRLRSLGSPLTPGLTPRRSPSVSPSDSPQHNILPSDPLLLLAAPRSSYSLDPSQSEQGHRRGSILSSDGEWGRGGTTSPLEVSFAMDANASSLPPPTSAEPGTLLVPDAHPSYYSSLEHVLATEQLERAKSVQQMWDSIFVPQPMPEYFVYSNGTVTDSTEIGKKMGVFKVVPSGCLGKSDSQCVVRTHPPPPPDPPRKSVVPETKPRPHVVMKRSKVLRCWDAEKQHQLPPVKATSNSRQMMQSLSQPQLPQEVLQVTNGKPTPQEYALKHRPGSASGHHPSSSHERAMSAAISRMVLNEKPRLLDGMSVAPALRVPKKLVTTLQKKNVK